MASSKSKDITKTLKRLIGYFGQHRKVFFLGLLLTTTISVMTLIGPQYLGRITDTLSYAILNGTDVDMDVIYGCVIILLFLYIGAALLTFTQNYLISVLSERIAAKMRKDLSRKFDQLPLRYLDGRTTGELMSYMVNDTQVISNGCSESIIHTVNAVMMMAGTIVMMLYTNVFITGFALAPVAASIVMVLLIIRGTQKYFRAQQEMLSRINGLVEEAYSGHVINRLYNNQGRLARRFGEFNQGLYRSAFLARVAQGTMPQLMGLINNLGYLVVCIVGSMLIVNGEIGYGTIVEFIVYERLATTPVVQFAESSSQLQSIASAAERIFAILDEEEMPDRKGIEGFEVREGRVELRNVCFSYEDGKEVIHDFSLTVEPGTKVAIVGPTGAGKTTLVNLISDFYDVDSGTILLDGVPIKDLSRSQVHRQFAIVLQDVWLFEGTIMENLKYTREDVSDEAVYKACEAAEIASFIESLPEGYDTVLKDSVQLSAGQKQQLTIARAIVRDAPMIILDEATSSVDTRTEKRIQAAMDRLLSGRTSFVIAHRLSTIVDSDLIIVMRDGSVVESGTHEELIELGGFYKMLYDSQFENCD